jgi:sugar lactone lactonase YvrE
MKIISMKFLFLIFLLVTSYLKVCAQNYVSTFSGSGTTGFVNGFRDTATYNLPFGLCRDRFGNTFVADGNHCIRKIDSAGMVTTYAGNGTAGFKDGMGDTAQFNSPSDLCADDSGNIYVSDFLNQRIRKIYVNRIVTTIAGNGLAGYVDGGTNARFNYPRGICRDNAGNIYVADSWNHRIRKIDLAGNVSTYAGGGSVIGVGSVGSLNDGADTAARFYTPSGLSIDEYDVLFVADAYNHRIRMIDTSRYVLSIAGSGATGQGNGGYADGSMGASVFNTPTELIYDRLHDKLYISDTFNNRIRLIDLVQGNVSTVAGTGAAGFVNGIDTAARFNFPRGISLGNNDEIYLCDYNNHSIRFISNSPLLINETEKESVWIYPNPSDGIFNLKLNSKAHIEIYNTDGSLIYASKINLTDSKVDLSEFESGIYLLKIGSSRSFRAIKLLKE